MIKPTRKPWTLPLDKLEEFQVKIGAGCFQCEFDEAEGGLVNHCKDCQHEITTAAYRLFVTEHYGLAYPWKPISTAPRDGTHILVANLAPDDVGFGWFDGRRVPFQAVAHWWHVEGEQGFYLSAGSNDIPLRVTHWRPLWDDTASTNHPS